jgi:hypothetical protein
MTAKLRLSIKDGVVELEGTEDFVERQIDKLESLLELIKQIPSEGKPHTEEEADSTHSESQQQHDKESVDPAGTLSIPDTFGEWMHKFREDISDQQKALVAAFFVQKRSTTNDFKTYEIGACLKEHGIKIANPSTSIQRLSSKKLTFQTRKVGKLIYMRVSKDGESNLKELLR